LTYPGSQALTVPDFGTLNPMPVPFLNEPENSLPRRAWRTSDSVQKVTEYFDKTLYAQNWVLDNPYRTYDGPWKAARYKKGDDLLALGVLGGLTSDDIRKMPSIGLKPADTIIVMAVGNPLDAYVLAGNESIKKGDWRSALVSYQLNPCTKSKNISPPATGAPTSG
jgi:hypothetical protein